VEADSKVPIQFILFNKSGYAGLWWRLTEKYQFNLLFSINHEMQYFGGGGQSPLTAKYQFNLFFSINHEMKYFDGGG